MSKRSKNKAKRATRKKGAGRQGPGPNVASAPSRGSRGIVGATAARPARPAGFSPAARPSDQSRGWTERATQEVLTPTYWFDPGDARGEPYSISVSFSGRRVGTTGKAGPGDEFAMEQTVEGIVPGSGPVAVTTEVRGVNAGEWKVEATPVRHFGHARHRTLEERHAVNGDRRGLWPQRGPSIRSKQPAILKTSPLAFARIPGVRQLVWGPLVFLGVLVGLALQALLLGRANRDIGAAIEASGLAILAGGIGAKAWYVAVHHGKRFDGWCIQGAVVGGVVVAVIVALAGIDVSVGAYLNAAAPGLMLGIAVGKPGCFWAGCCTGRPTASRWGIWSSDRRLGIRRIPAQLMEAFLGLAIGITALAIVLAAGLGDSGELFIGAVAAYTLGRQVILPLRAEARQTSLGRPLTMALAALVLVADVLVAVVG